MVVTPLITSPYISRVLGAENIGIYSYNYSIAYYFGIFCMFGIANYGVRSIAKVKLDDRKARSTIFWEIYTMQIITSFFVILAYSIYLYCSDIDYWENAQIELIYVLSVAVDVYWYYFGTEQFQKTTARSFVVKLSTLLSILLFVKDRNDLNLYTIIMAVGSLISSLILWIVLFKQVDFVRVKWSNVMRHAKPNLTLFIPVVSLAIFHYTDKLMIGWLSTMDELGYYSNADKVINIPTGLVAGLGVVMLPRISSLSAKCEWKQINDYIHKSLVFSMWIGTAICFGIISISTDFVPLFFGPGFDKCIALMVALSPVLLFKSWHHILRMQYLIPLGKDMQFNISVIVAAILNILVNWLLIPQMGAIGAVIGTLAAEFCVAFFYTWFARKFVNTCKAMLLTSFYIVAGIIMYSIVNGITPHLAAYNLIIRLVIEIIIGAFIYLSITSIVMYVTKNEVMYIIIDNLRKIFFRR